VFLALYLETGGTGIHATQTAFVLRRKEPLTLVYLTMHDKFLLLNGSRDAFFNTILADHIIVLIALAHITGIFHAHTGLHMAFLVFQTFGKNS
jgi:hypothetical protein